MWTLVAAMPRISTASVSMAKSSRGREATIRAIVSNSAPASTRAPSTMSPVMPEKQSKYASRTSDPVREGLAPFLASSCGSFRAGEESHRILGTPTPSPSMVLSDTTQSVLVLVSLGLSLLVVVVLLPSALRDRKRARSLVPPQKRVELLVDAHDKAIGKLERALRRLALGERKLG